MGLTALRVELKYRVPADRADAFGERLPPHETRAYALTTTYLDRPDGSLSRQAMATPFQCTKIRLREYGAEPPAVWVEIKNRSWAWTRKLRFAIARTEVPALLSGGPVSPLPPESDAPAALHDLNKAYAQLRAGPDPRLVPLGGVTARRTTWSFPEARVRFSLDREIAYYAPPPAEGGLGTPLAREDGAVLEIKDGGKSPQWCHAAAAGLEPVNYSKFRRLVQILREAGRVD